MPFFRINKLLDNSVTRVSSTSQSDLGVWDYEIENVFIIPDSDNVWFYKYDSDLNQIIENTLPSTIRARVWFQVTRNPTKAFRFYKYLSADAILKYGGQNIDVTVPPKSFDYKVDVQPKLRKIPTISPDGFLSLMTYHGNDFEDTINSEFGEFKEEVLKRTFEYTLLNDSSIQAGKSALKRKEVLEFCLEDGTYPSDDSFKKITWKPYEDRIVRKNEGVRRRQNIKAISEEQFITLIALLIVPDNSPLTAEELGSAFLRRYQGLYSSYEELARTYFIDAINEESSLDTILDTHNLPIQAGVTFNSLLDTFIPNVAPINLLYPQAVNMTIRNFMSERYKGNI